ncbi:MAG: hypothetical protein F6J93_31040 [Oscillatoria sp. SIO1A7]|nr:hypothetical protein [Oscillatoria sp. SIO1A7]
MPLFWSCSLLEARDRVKSQKSQGNKSCIEETLPAIVCNFSTLDPGEPSLLTFDF